MSSRRTTRAWAVCDESVLPRSTSYPAMRVPQFDFSAPCLGGLLEGHRHRVLGMQHRRQFHHCVFVGDSAGLRQPVPMQLEELQWTCHAETRSCSEGLHILSALPAIARLGAFYFCLQDASLNEGGPVFGSWALGTYSCLSSFWSNNIYKVWELLLPPRITTQRGLLSRFSFS